MPGTRPGMTKSKVSGNAKWLPVQSLCRGLFARLVDRDVLAMRQWRDNVSALYAFVLVNHFFEQLAFFRSLFSRIAKHVLNKIVFSIVFYAGSLLDLCVGFRIAPPQFRQRDNATRSKF